MRVKLKVLASSGAEEDESVATCAWKNPLPRFAMCSIRMQDICLTHLRRKVQYCTMAVSSPWAMCHGASASPGASGESQDRCSSCQSFRKGYHIPPLFITVRTKHS